MQLPPPKEEEKRLQKAIDMNETTLENFSLMNYTRERTLTAMVPPFNITDLVPESKYSILITTTLGREFTSTLEIDDVYTTANNSIEPEGIVDVTAAVGSEFRFRF